MLKRHAAQLQGINCFFNLLLNPGNVLESFIFFGIIFHNTAPLEFSAFIPYFVVLVPDNFTTLSHLKLQGISWFSKKHDMNCGFNVCRFKDFSR